MRETRHDYEELKIFIADNHSLRNIKGVAKFLNKTYQAIRVKLAEGKSFTNDEIIKFKREFNLTPKQVDAFFFKVKD